MIVVSNTSPLCYLAWIGKLHLLPSLFDEILIPPEVLDELTAAETPEPVRRALSFPSFLAANRPCKAVARCGTRASPTFLTLGPHTTEALPASLWLRRLRKPSIFALSARPRRGRPRSTRCASWGLRKSPTRFPGPPSRDPTRQMCQRQRTGPTEVQIRNENAY